MVMYYAFIFLTLLPILEFWFVFLDSGVYVSVGVSFDDSSFDSSIVVMVLLVEEVSACGFLRCADFFAAIVRIVLDDGDIISLLLLLWLWPFVCTVDFGRMN